MLILQPTRVIQRKGIEHSIELLHRLNDKRCKLVIAHASGDEGDVYAKRVRNYADLLGVDVIFADRFIGACRGRGPFETNAVEKPAARDQNGAAHRRSS